MLITYVGISGSGKSRLTSLMQKGRVVISPDQIRKQLTGDISNQTQNKRVFELAYEQLDAALGRGDDVIFDATNLDMKSLNRLASRVKFYHEKMIVYVLMDSKNPACCGMRVHYDLKKGADRSAVSDEVIDNQASRFANMLTLLDDWERDNSDFASVIRYEASI